jgi:hypothetical protein
LIKNHFEWKKLEKRVFQFDEDIFYPFFKAKIVEWQLIEKESRFDQVMWESERLREKDRRERRNRRESREARERREMIERGTGYRGRIVDTGVTGKTRETRDRGRIVKKGDRKGVGKAGDRGGIGERGKERLERG